MSNNRWTWNRLFRAGDRVERRASRRLERRDRIGRRIERSGLTSLRIAHLRARLRRISRRVERVETRRQEVIRALKVKWLADRDLISG